MIEIADASTSSTPGQNKPPEQSRSSSMKDIIEIPDSDQEMDDDVTETKHDVINSNHGLIEHNNDVIEVDGDVESAELRISKKLGVSVERARAALKIAGNDVDSAVDIISRQLRKV